MTEFSTFSDAMADAAERAGASTVRVEARRRMAATGIVWRADGVIVTANHVVRKDDNIHIGLADGSTVPAALVGRDPSTDIAVLKAEADGLAVPTWIKADDLRVGSLVLALGRPGQSIQATLGVVSAVGGAWRTGAGGKVDRYVQTDVLMYPGFSGGPLVAADGSVAGLNSSSLTRGASVALPTETLTRVVTALLAHGKMKRGYLGVGIQPVRLSEQVAEQVGRPGGLLVMNVEAGSPAESGGLFLGDTLLAVDGEPVQRPDDLSALLSADRVGQSVPISVVRGGQISDVIVVIGEQSTPFPLTHLQSPFFHISSLLLRIALLQTFQHCSDTFSY